MSSLVSADHPALSPLKNLVVHSMRADAASWRSYSKALDAAGQGIVLRLEGSDEDGFDFSMEGVSRPQRQDAASHLKSKQRINSAWQDQYQQVGQRPSIRVAVTCP
jgi:hypothetical protein